MLLNLKELFETPGKVLPFSHSLNLSDIKKWGRQAVSTPVAIAGTISNHLDVITVEYTASFNQDVTCDRCIAAFHSPQKYSFTHTVVRKLYNEGNDDYIVVPDAILDIETMAQSDVVLELPNRVLCSESCKGLCQTCGQDLNKKQCDCHNQTIDPRLEALRKLLD